MASYTSTQSGDFNTSATWGGGGWPSSDDDTYTVSAGHTVTVTQDNVGHALGASTINGLLTFSPTANGRLRHSGLVTIGNGGELRLGDGAAPIQAGYTAELRFAPGADNTEMLQINAGGKLTCCGAATYNLASEAWASCYTVLSAQANSGQKNATLSDATMASKAVAGQRFLIQGTTSYNQDEIMTVDTVAGSTITFTTNFTYTHASGAYAVPLDRNVIIRSTLSSQRGWIDNDNTTVGAGINAKLTEFRALYKIDGLTSTVGETFDYCVFASCYQALRQNTNTAATNCIFADGYNALSSTYDVYLNCAMLCKMSDDLIDTCNGLKAQTVIGFGCNKIIRASSGAFQIVDFAFSNSSANDMAGIGGEMVLVDGSMSSMVTVDGRVSCRNVVFSDEASNQIRYGGSIRSQDHNGVIGAAKSSFYAGTIERQDTVARSGYAAELTPNSACSSNWPLEIEWDIPCEHGDVVTISVYVRVNATYGTANDPTLVLDPYSLYGCNDTSTENVTVADTWTELTATGTVDLGGADVKGTVNVVLRVPYYVSGGKVYVDDFSVTKAEE